MLAKSLSNKDRHYGLDVVRAVAIIAVVLYHWPRSQDHMIFRAISHFGYLGVDLFFVLSGFLIASQTFGLIKKNEFTVKRFFFSRLMRTLPNYFFVLAIVVLIEGYIYYDFRYLFFLQNIGGLYRFTHSWSLCVEEHFYLVFPLLLAFLTKQKWLKSFPVIVFLILVAQIIIRYFIWNHIRPDLAYKVNVDQGFELYFKNLFYPTFCRMDGHSIGALIAFIKHFEPKMWEMFLKRSHLFLICSVLSFFPLAYSIYHKTGMMNSVFGFTVISLCMAGIVISSLSEKSVLQKIKIPGITFVSILSYSIYLTHGLALHGCQLIIQYLNLDSYEILSTLIRIASILCFASALYWGLEKPVLNLRDRMLKKEAEADLEVKVAM